MRSHSALGALCASLLLLERQKREVGLQHVKTHEGNPFNELADGLAKKTARGGGTDLPKPLV
eukprot:9145811-Lingulodinium_polyedra.AAC.1